VFSRKNKKIHIDHTPLEQSPNQNILNITLDILSFKTGFKGVKRHASMSLRGHMGSILS
jgi:hypothetical protein